MSNRIKIDRQDKTALMKAASKARRIPSLYNAIVDEAKSNGYYINKFPGKCYFTGANVAKGDGFVKRDGRSWVTVSFPFLASKSKVVLNGEG